MFVAHHHEGAETKTTAAFHDFCRTIDENHLLAQIAAFLAVGSLVPRIHRPVSATSSGTAAAAPSRASRWEITFRLISHNVLLNKVKPANPPLERHRPVPCL